MTSPALVSGYLDPVYTDAAWEQDFIFMAAASGDEIDPSWAGCGAALALAPTSSMRRDVDSFELTSAAGDLVLWTDEARVGIRVTDCSGYTPGEYGWELRRIDGDGIATAVAVGLVQIVAGLSDPPLTGSLVRPGAAKGTITVRPAPVATVATAVGPKGERGTRGWSPVLNSVMDGARGILRISDWVLGEGEKPGTGYLRSDGTLTQDIAQATDFLAGLEAARLDAIAATAAAAAATAAATTATTSANTATTNANTATTNANTATTNANAATSAANTATAAANTATTQANTARDGADTAAGSANAAASAATAATTAAVTATNNANAATAAANTATTQANTARDSANAAAAAAQSVVDAGATILAAKDTAVAASTTAVSAKDTALASNATTQTMLLQSYANLFSLTPQIITGGSYSITDADNGKLLAVDWSDSTPAILYVENLSVGFYAGIVLLGSGGLVFKPGLGTVLANGDKLYLTDRYLTQILRKISSSQTIFEVGNATVPDIAIDRADFSDAGASGLALMFFA